MKAGINKAAARLDAAIDELVKGDTSSLHNATYSNVVMTARMLLRGAISHMRQFGSRPGYDIMDTFDTVQKAANSLSEIHDEASARPSMEKDWKARARLLDAISRTYSAAADFNSALHEAGYQLD